jgi:hypothetical protein
VGNHWGMSRLRIDVLKFNSFVNCPKFPIFLVPLCLSLRNRCTEKVKKTADRFILLRIALLLSSRCNFSAAHMSKSES